MPPRETRRKSGADLTAQRIKQESPALSPVDPSTLFVPLELFVCITEELNNEDRVRTSHVSRAWRKAILMEPKLWQTLEVNLGNAEVSLERTKVYLDRSGGKLLSVRVTINCGAANNDSNLAAYRKVPPTLHQVLFQLSKTGSQSIRTFYVDLMRYNCTALRQTGADLLKRVAVFVQNACPEIDDFCCLSSLLDAEAAPFVNLTPCLRHLTLTSRPRDSGPLRDFIPQELGLDSWSLTPPASNLTHLTLYGATILKDSLPALPRLESLSLFKHLSLVGISHTEPPSSLLPGSESACAGQLIFPRLLSFHISGSVPSLWGKPTPNSSDFAIAAPNLLRVVFASSLVLLQDLELRKRMSKWWKSFPHVANSSFQKGCLIPLFRSSLKLEELDLRDGDFSSLSLLDTLREAPPTIHTLSLPRTTSDALVECLLFLLPSLKTLRISGGEGFLPLSARLALSMEQRKPAKQHHFFFHLAIAPTFPSLNDVESLREVFEDTLRKISKDQVGSLLASIWNDFTPNGNTLQTISTEVFEMWRTSSLTDSNGEESVPRGPGSEEDFSMAEEAMGAWSTSREVYLAMGWMKRAESRGFFVVYELELED